MQQVIIEKNSTIQLQKVEKVEVYREKYDLSSVGKNTFNRKYK